MDRSCQAPESLLRAPSCSVIDRCRNVLLLFPGGDAALVLPAAQASVGDYIGLISKTRLPES